MNRDARIFVAGHVGLVGSAITFGLDATAYLNVLVDTRLELSLRDQGAVFGYITTGVPDSIFSTDARAGDVAINNTRLG